MVCTHMDSEDGEGSQSEFIHWSCAKMWQETKYMTSQTPSRMGFIWFTSTQMLNLSVEMCNEFDGYRRLDLSKTN